MLARRTRLLILLVAGTFCARNTAAEPSEDVIAEQVKSHIAPLREWLPLELRFAREVCGLSDEQVAALRQAAEDEIDLIAKNTAATLRRPLMIRVGKVRVINGRAAPAAAVLDEELIGAPSALAHSIVWRTLQEKWPDAWQQFDAERQRLEARRKRAAIMAEVASLDEQLWFTGRQRTELCDWLADERADVRREGTVATVVDPAVEQLKTTLAGGSLGVITFPEAALAKFLLPSQLAAFKDSQRPWREDVLIAKRVAPKRVVAARKAAPPQDTVAQEAAAVELDAARQEARRAQQAQVEVVRRQQVLAAMQEQVIRRGLPLDEQRRRLALYIERLTETIDRLCGFTESQRDKLLLAGKLDIEKLRENSPTANQQFEAAPEGRVVHQVRVGGSDSGLPLKIFSDESSYFHKALRGTLLDEQKRKLADAARERRDFERRALIEAAVVGFERAAALTSRQCEELSLVLDAALAEIGQDTADNWRAACARQIAQVEDARLAAVVTDVQLPFVKRHQAAIGEAAAQFEQASDAAPRPVIGGGMF